MGAKSFNALASFVNISYDFWKFKPTSDTWLDLHLFEMSLTKFTTLYVLVAHKLSVRMDAIVSVIYFQG